MSKETDTKKMQLLLQYAAKIAETRELDNLLAEIADMGRLLIGADRSTVWLLDEERGTLWSKLAHGVSRIEVPMDSGVVGEAVRIKDSIVSNDPYSLPFFNRDVDRSTGYTTKSLLTIPMFDEEGNVFGVFQCTNKITDDYKFTEEDVTLLHFVTSYAEKTILAAQLAKEIEATQIEIIFLMSEIGESRSKETGNHVKRVAAISERLAQLAGLSEYDVGLLLHASPMHDIGKVAIPDSVLLKPGKLTDEEFAHMKSHTAIGYQLLSGSKRPIIKAASIVTHEHHEKWNGSGYPRGIAGEDIHIFGRITAIADVFDALACERVYKPAWEKERVRKLFEEESGRHFDPELCKIFLEHFDEFYEIVGQYKDV